MGSDQDKRRKRSSLANETESILKPPVRDREARIYEQGIHLTGSSAAYPTVLGVPTTEALGAHAHERERVPPHSLLANAEPKRNMA